MRGNAPSLFNRPFRGQRDPPPASSWFDAPRGLKPKRRPEDQGGLRICHNFSNSHLAKIGRLSYIVAIVRKRGRAWRGALGRIRRRARGGKFLFGIRRNQLISLDSYE